jgi:hypothetical protein
MKTLISAIKKCVLKEYCTTMIRMGVARSSQLTASSRFIQRLFDIRQYIFNMFQAY